MPAISPKATRALLSLVLLGFLLGGTCGVSYPVEVKVEVVGQGGLEKAKVAVYVTTETALQEQVLPFEAAATIAQKGEAVTVKAAMVDGQPGFKLTIRILTGTETVASETSEDPGQTLTATWAPE